MKNNEAKFAPLASVHNLTIKQCAVCSTKYYRKNLLFHNEVKRLIVPMATSLLTRTSKEWLT
jgi:hypothetical protein